MLFRAQIQATLFCILIIDLSNIGKGQLELKGIVLILFTRKGTPL